MTKAEKFKKFWQRGRKEVKHGLMFAEKDTGYYTLVALNLLLEAKERSLFPEDFKED